MGTKKTLDLEPIITGLCYRKTETLTETEIRQAIAEAILNFGVEYVTTLPTGDNIKQKVYIMPDTSGTTGNFGDIYVYDRTNSKWIHIDALKFNIDDYLLIADIVDDLTTPLTNKALSANQGKVLKALVDTKVNTSDIKDNLISDDTDKPLSANQGYLLNQNKIDKTAIATRLDVDDNNKVLSAKQGKKLQDDKQDKTDNTLSTDTKTVVGAINELNSHVNDLFNNSDFKQVHITVTRDNNVTSKETWLLVNARYDETENKFYKIDKNEKAFGIQFQASGTYPGEENIDQNNQAISIWRCPSQSELIAAFGQQTVEEVIPNGEIGWSFDNGQTWITFGVMAGWNNLVMFDSYGGFTVGGNGIEVDGNGIFPYMRLTSSKYTINNEEVYLYGIIINAYHNASGVDDTDRAWFFGIKAPQRKNNNDELITNTSDLFNGSFVIMYNDSADTTWSSSSWVEVPINKPTLFDGDYNSLTNKPNLDNKINGYGIFDVDDLATYYEAYIDMSQYVQLRTKDSFWNCFKNDGEFEDKSELEIIYFYLDDNFDFNNDMEIFCFYESYQQSETSDYRYFFYCRSENNIREMVFKDGNDYATQQQVSALESRIQALEQQLLNLENDLLG